MSAPKHPEQEAGAQSEWREEVNSRLENYRARRRRNAGSASLKLDFDPAPPIQVSSARARAQELVEQFKRQVDAPIMEPVIEPEAEIEIADPPIEETFFAPEEPVTRVVTENPMRRFYIDPVPPPPQPVQPKLIEFPRLSTVVDPPQDELAEPMDSTPRILDVPEEVIPQVAAPAPLSHIELATEEDAHVDEEFTLELPVQPAPLGQRIYAAMFDTVIVMSGAGAFWMVLLLTVGLPVNAKLGLAFGGMTTVLLWATYHYLFLVYSRWTPGMLMARLELCTFHGEEPTVRERQFRTAAMMLSVAAAGLGYLWSALDEDQLGWHDRISRTYMRLN